MTELVAQARTAREKLAAALALLQDPEAGNLIDSVAEPVARAMGALHQVESSGGEKLTEKAPAALDAVRAALAALQSQPSSAIAEQATEHIAGSLGLVHGLAEQAKQLARAPAAPEPARPAMQPGALDKTQMAPSASPVIPMPSAKPAPAAPGGALDATLPTPTRPPNFSSNPGLDSTQASVRAPEPPFDATRPSAPAPEMARKASSRPARNSKMAPAPSGGRPQGAQEVEANLGAHSPTNFYKGLSGNDVVDDGGLFVATYDIPPIGTKLWLSVNMPGGYQFEALAEVRWTRESGVGDAPPGFGCAFKDITDEARKLVYRYVKNREPLFHDDL
jgi:hypothetical protein